MSYRIRIEASPDRFSRTISADDLAGAEMILRSVKSRSSHKDIYGEDFKIERATLEEKSDGKWRFLRVIDK